MADKLGFTFYPKDWWTSDTFFDLTPVQRYIYLECLFIMYSNDGYIKTQKTQFENRIRISVSDNDWKTVVSKFIIENDMYTHHSVNKRLRKTIANRLNGQKGGRPKSDSKEPKEPKEPKKETQKNPPLEREREREKKENINNILMSELSVSDDGLNLLHKGVVVSNSEKEIGYFKVAEKFRREKRFFIHFIRLF